MKRRLPVFASVMLLLGAADVGAQTLNVPLIEAGVQAIVIGLTGDGFQENLAVGPRLTINFTQDHALELATDTILPSEGHAFYGLYLVQYKWTPFRPLPAHATAVFLTAGAGGFYSRRQVGERRTARPDGSVAVFPAHAAGEIGGLRMGKFGLGVERRLNAHVAARVEADALAGAGGFGFRAVASLSIPIGGYRAR
jgi:hypothetical protein